MKIPLKLKIKKKKKRHRDNYLTLSEAEERYKLV